MTTPAPLRLGRIVTPMNELQENAIFRKWKIDPNGLTWIDFLKTAEPTFAMDDAVVLPWCGMFLAIETTPLNPEDDFGHTHS